MSNPICRDRFEEIGTAMQEKARTFEQAKRCFDISCTKCTFRSRPHDCECCPIRATLLAKADHEWYKLRAEDYLWLELEQNSAD